MKTFSLRGFGKEKFIRVCGMCKKGDACNYCKYMPVNPEKHKCQYVCSEQIWEELNWFEKYILGKKEITEIKKCVCGRERND